MKGICKRCVRGTMCGRVLLMHGSKFNLDYSRRSCQVGRSSTGQVRLKDACVVVVVGEGGR